MVQLRNLSFSYSGQQVIKSLTVKFSHHKTTAILGPSGCGKTTLLKLIADLIKPASGEIITESNNGIGFVFQDFCLLPWSTVEENIALVFKGMRISRAEQTNKIDQMLSITGLTGVKHQYPRELSGGMKQRVGLARALVVQPELLLLDEPFSAVDGQTRQLLVEEFRALCTLRPMTRLLVTHQIDDVLDLADELILLSTRPAELFGSIDVQQSLQSMTRDVFKQRIWLMLKDQVKSSDLMGVA